MVLRFKLIEGQVEQPSQGIPQVIGQVLFTDPNWQAADVNSTWVWAARVSHVVVFPIKL